MQSLLNQKYGSFLTNNVGYWREKKGSISGQDPQEYNMDMWNNQQGPQIYNEIRREYPNFNKLSEQQQKDIIAGKVVQRMKEGKLITGLDDPRKFEKQKPLITPMPWIGGVQNNGRPLGFAADIDINQLTQQLGLQSFNTEIPQHTREDVGSMSSDEFVKLEKEIDAQTKLFNGTMPTNGDLQREATSGGGVVYVNSYTCSDGTEVKGYYRSRTRF